MFKTFLLFFAIASSPNNIDWQPLGNPMTEKACKGHISKLLETSQGYSIVTPEGYAIFINPANVSERILLTCVNQVRTYEVNN